MYLHAKLETDVGTHKQDYSYQMLFVFPSLSVQTFLIQYISSVVYLSTQKTVLPRSHTVVRQTQNV